MTEPKLSEKGTPRNGADGRSPWRGGDYAAADRPEGDAPAAPTMRRRTAWLLGALALLALAALFFLGYLPRHRREQRLAADVQGKKTALPDVRVAQTRLSSGHSDLLLPGNITPLTEATINARADGYLRKRYVDIGDHVRSGQLLAELEAPELDQQVQQGRATVSQTRAALSRAEHALTQAQANQHLAEVTVQRWKTLVDRGVVSRQEYDQQQANFQSQTANVQAAQADVGAAGDNVRAAEANLQRLLNLQGYEKIRAPFSGIITARNVDVGSLIASNGNTPMFKEAQIDVLRIIVNVPEASAPFIRVGEQATITLQEFAGRTFTGHVARTANSLDANTRTLPAEVQVRNADGALMPNMYAQVTLLGARTTPSVLIPGDSLMVRSNGTQVAVIGPGNRVHLQPVEVGRDYGPEIEIRSGLAGGEYVIGNPTDDVREGVEVHPVAQKQLNGENSGAPHGGAAPVNPNAPGVTGSGSVSKGHPGEGTPERKIGAAKR